LDRFTVGARPATLSATVVGARGVAPRVSAALSMATSVTGGLRAPTMMRAASAMRAGVPSARGVDLNLDDFNLTEAAATWAGDLACVEAQAPIGEVFWSSLDGGATAFRDKDARLLREVFHPKLSDRRDESCSFVPPETSPVYLAKLSEQVKKEAAVREARAKHFVSGDFKEDDAGPLFPSSWQASFRIAGQQGPKKWLGCPPQFSEKAVFDWVVGAGKPIFDRSTEDGTFFRVYRRDSLEVRTIKEAGGKETLRAIYCIEA
jgi:hypothetical protein